MSHRARNELKLAKRAFGESIVLKQFDDLAPLELAKTFQSLGQNARARQVAMVPPSVELPGGTAIRLDDEYCDAMIEDGGRRSAHVLDTRSILSGEPVVFFDNVHFGNEGHRKIARILHEFVVGSGLLTDDGVRQ